MPGYYEYRIHLGIVRYAKQANWILIKVMQKPKRHVDGIISFHAYRPEIIDAIKSVSCPVIGLNALDLRKTDMPILPVVIHDNQAIGKMGGEYLSTLGFTDIAYAQSSDHPNDVDRMEGIKQEVEKRERNFHLLDYHNLKEGLLSLPRGSALMCPNDMLAVHVMRVCEDLDLQVPHDIAILGVDDDTLQCELSPVPLSSINTALEEVGYRAAELLDGMMSGQDIPDATLIPPVSIVTRQSTDLCAVSHLQTSKALKYLKENYQQKLNLDQVSSLSGMCRRRLEDAFNKYVGHSMRNEVTRLHLDHAMRLLRETDLKLRAVADESGFSSFEQMSRVFKREHHIAPAEYRTRFQQKS